MFGLGIQIDGVPVFSEKAWPGEEGPQSPEGHPGNVQLSFPSVLCAQPHV